MNTAHVDGIGRFYLTPDGDYPSVTTVLGAFGDKTALEEWRMRVGEDRADAITKEAADIGTHLHNLFEAFLLDNILPKSETSEEKKALSMFRISSPKLRSLVDSVIMMETPVWSNAFRIAGRFDCLAYVDGKVTLIDFKNTRSMKTRESISSYRQQLAFYAIMIQERFNIVVEQMMIFMVNREGFVQKFFFQPEETPRKELVSIRKHFWEKYQK